MLSEEEIIDEINYIKWISIMAWETLGLQKR